MDAAVRHAPARCRYDRAEMVRNTVESEACVLVYLIDNYDSFTFNLFHYLGGLGAKIVVHRNDRIAAADVIAADPDAIVLSPGPCTPDDAGICLDLIAKASRRVPIF